MLKVRDFLGKKERVKGVGLEIEVEFTGTAPIELDVGGPWLNKPEGSLRNGAEFYTRQPLPVNETKIKHIRLLTDRINQTGRAVEDSKRTSVHVHVNVMQLSLNELWTAILGYWILENPLMQFCGANSRVGNLFCLRVQDAEGILNTCYQDLRSKVPFSYLDNEITKYCGQNIGAIPRFGSLEYRGMRGTISPTLIDLWSTTLSDMVDNAARFGTPSKLMDFYAKSSKDEFIHTILPPAMIEQLNTIPEYKGLIDKHVAMLSELAYFHDWDEWEASINADYMKNKLSGQLPPDMVFRTVAGDVPLDVFAAGQRRVRPNVFTNLMRMEEAIRTINTPPAVTVTVDDDF